MSKPASSKSERGLVTAPKRRTRQGEFDSVKVRITRKVQRDKTKYMSGEAFADLKHALEDMLAFERGERRSFKVTRIEGSRRPKGLSALETVFIQGRHRKRHATRNLNT